MVDLNDHHDRLDTTIDSTLDSYYKINIDCQFLTDKVRIINDKIRKTPWYRIGTLLKLNRELKDLEKEADKIGERIKKLEENPIQIVRRT